jgi:hypothetical protein
LPIFSNHKFKQKKWENFWNLKTHSQKQIVGQNNSSKKGYKNSSHSNSTHFATRLQNTNYKGNQGG